jgi:peptidoglycan/xylan/chitin deacetylase (PgdA/CDA1 family)
MRSSIFRIGVLLVSLLYWMARPLRRVLAGTAGGGNAAPVCILCYHGIADRLRARFTWQMQHLAKHCQPVEWTGLGRVADGRARVLVTFDDALISLQRNAFPILASLNIPCVVFVPTAQLGSRCVWMRSPEEFAAAQGRPMPARDLEQLATERVMTRDELAALDFRLIALASHGTRHRKLALLPAEELEEELRQSKSCLEEITGQKVDLVSYPHGSYDSTVLETQARLGYRLGFSIEPIARPGPPEVYGRMVVEPSDWRLEFALKAAGAYEWLFHYSRLVRWLRKGARAGAQAPAPPPPRPG